MRQGTTVEARERIEAPPEVIYDLVADVTRMGDWSPECVSCEWIDGATGPTVGARFRARNRHGLARWSNKPRVIAADRGHEFGFVAVDPFGHDMTRWIYRMEPTATGATVTESFAMVRTIPLYIRLYDRWVMGVKDRKADLEANMRATLSKIRTAAEKATVDHT
ncbi:MAG TPA: SRPBCC family protein [Acidimicrobiales bacterium]|nr:SRPBCC family protein [Acidimicrobiales bacterium]